MSLAVKKEPVTIEQLRDIFRLTDVSGVHDVFAEAYSNLQATYMRAQRTAAESSEKELWADRIQALRRFRRNLGAADSESLMSAIVMIQTERIAFEQLLD
ncbi:hypothetical protein EH165_14910 [Nakamurella antarctica]|uniref:Uncharacterized protein n=1 Tax=Nakamurella antarctica TaxID=1902245 RepID=A0A3G8ZR09_9ACTN|nr:hypothetical protein [Nakamurella antarctica]AZI59237.1 hypothetical protein EH165_14910 [Nakamurella antarctica]